MPQPRRGSAPTHPLPRIRIVRSLPHGGLEVACHWLSDALYDYACTTLAAYREEEPSLEWRLEVCGETMNWHEPEATRRDLIDTEGA